jgi:hypothetical protein
MLGPFIITEIMSPVAYRVELPLALAEIRDVLDVSTLRRYVHDPLDIVDFKPLHIQANLRYNKLPVQILDRKEQKLRMKTIALVKVLWHNHDVEEASWELEREMQDKYPRLF